MPYTIMPEQKKILISPIYMIYVNHFRNTYIRMQKINLLYNLSKLMQDIIITIIIKCHK